MIYWIAILVLVTFLLLNSKIICSDLKDQKIPNKELFYLLLLLPVWFFIYGWTFHLEIFLLRTLIITVLSFILFHFWYWWAGDAKYIIILSLFIPHISLYTFLWNIWVITLLYLAISYLYYFFGKILVHHDLRKVYKDKILCDIKNTYLRYFWNTSQVKQSLVYVWVFLMGFMFLRLIKFYILHSLLQTNLSYYKVYTIAIVSFLIFGIISLYKKYSHKISSKIILVWGIISLFFLWKIIYSEYQASDYTTIHILIRIFTLYLWIYIIFKIFKYTISLYSWKEYYSKDIHRLSKGDILERQSFDSKVLPLIWSEKRVLDYYDIPRIGNIIIDNENKKNLIKLIRSFNRVNKKKFWGNSIVESLDCMRTFSFSIFIFWWFLLSIVIWNTIFKYIASWLLSW